MLEGYGRGRETHGAGDLEGGGLSGLHESEDGLDTVLVVVGGLHLRREERVRVVMEESTLKAILDELMLTRS